MVFVVDVRAALFPSFAVLRPHFAHSTQNSRDTAWLNIRIAVGADCLLTLSNVR